MDPRTQERVEQWDSRPFSGGKDGLADLADEGFSGAVMANGVWLFVLNGRAVGVDGGDLEDFENASGTAYVAPDPAPPLLAAMKTRGGETRAKYYTNKTPLEDVDETLQDGSFTGYVELSEQVLSGDYYLVYYGGRRMAAAYIGNAERLLTGEEAFDRAADEVGLYEVVDVEVDVTDLSEVVDTPQKGDSEPEPEPEPEPATEPEPEPTETEPEADDATPAGDATGASSKVPDATPGEEPETDEVPGGVTVADATTEKPETDLEEPAEATEVDVDAGEADAPEAEAPTTAAKDGEDRAVDEDAVEEYDESTVPSSPTEQAEPDPTAGQPTDESETETAERPAETTSQRGSPGETGRPSSLSERSVGTTESTETDDLDERFKQEERWRETRSIPSIDPENTSESAKRSGRQSTGTTESGSTPSSTTSVSRGASTLADRSTASRQPAAETRSNEPSTDAGSRGNDGRSGERVTKLKEQRDTLKAKLEEVRQGYEALEQRRSELEDERDALRAENEELSATVERLEGRIADLEDELERARAVDATAAVEETASGTRVPAERALDGTNLFVRYGSKGKATLESVHAGEADRSEVTSNLRLEHHTDFDASEATIDGQPYEEFLPTTTEFTFVEWLVDTLLYEIRDTGRKNGLADLYDAIPKVDRIEFSATVSLADDDTEDVPEEVHFDVVAFDKMGNPLVIANLNDTRDPATRGMLERLEETASAVKANYPELAAAVAVTSSFFQPGALEVSEEATSGGLLSRSSKLNYVNISRKRGYHLCLVEARSGGFHMTVPEL